jgi:hypothetical protein
MLQGVCPQTPNRTEPCERDTRVFHSLFVLFLYEKLKLQGYIAQRGAVGVVGAFALSTSAKQIEQSKVLRG